ncbi:hypothetical protein [Streptomyces sp. NPDC018031]|uniref:hypothetical protein n=1 Tax=Streptomyces sp. NPDC018031 TaxID=3365033 RepID=UPI00379F9B66
MAKNKNRERAKPRSRSSSERGEEQGRSAEDRAEQMRSQMGSPDVPHKGRQKRFGHN